MRAGDTLVIWKIDRLARSLRQLIGTVETLSARDIGLYSLTEAIGAASDGRLIFHIFGVLAEFEHAVIRERIRAERDAARARGRVRGRPAGLSAKDLSIAKALLRNPEITVEQVAKRLGVVSSTLYRCLPSGHCELD